MLKAYINYPNPHVTAHFDPTCGMIQSQSKEDQRYIQLDIETLSAELLKFNTKEHRFGTFPHNDMWVEIDFMDRDFELAILRYICKILEQRYQPFESLVPNIHC